jgi:hypothetical protein
MERHDLKRPHLEGAASVDGSQSPFRSEDFSLVLGGPLFQMLRRARLTDDAMALARTRILVLSLAAWLPLLALSVLEGQALWGSATVPFLLDVDVHVRFLVALPLLVAAELVVHHRMRSVARVFLDRHLIPDAELPRFEAAFASAVRLRNSVLADGPAPRLRLRRGHPDRLAPLHGASARPRGTPRPPPPAFNPRSPGCGTAM